MPKATKESIDKKIENLEEKKIKVHMEEESKKIGDLTCLKCGEPLNVNPEDFMKRGTKAKLIICPNCEIQNRVQIKYSVAPEELGEAEISRNVRDYAWETKSPSLFTMEDIKRWIGAEAERIQAKKGRYPSKEMQIIILALNSILNEETEVVIKDAEVILPEPSGE